MGKRKRRKRRRNKRAEPTLFDLPLQSGGDPADAGAGPPPVAGSTAGQGPSILFDDESDGQDLLLEPAELPSASSLPLSQGAAVEEVTPDVQASDVQAPRVPVQASRAPDGPAPLGDRFLGGLTDLAAQLIALGVAIAATHAMAISVTVERGMPFVVLALVFSFLYWTVPLAFWGQTPGMAWVGHTARSLSGEPLSFGQTFLRWLGSVLTLAFAGLPLLITLSGRSLTDRISGSQTTAAG